jgi:hypothetical protein
MILPSVAVESAPVGSLDRGRFLPFVVGLLFGSCSAAATRAELDASHPAHPGAREANFTPALADWTSPDLGAPRADAIVGYACPMHDEARTERPGTCAECGMDFVPFYRTVAP